MKKNFLLAITTVIAASLACSVPFLGSKGGEDSVIIEDITEEPQGIPKLGSESFDAAIEDLSLLSPASLSPAQAQVLSQRGSPNRFVIQFIDGMRQETWYYDRMGYEVIFRNGEIYTENQVEVLVGEAIFYSIYFPWQFIPEMGLPELLSITDSDTFVFEAVEEIFEEDLSIAYLKGLDVGFRGDQVLYIRTIPLGEGAKAGSPAFVLEQPAQIDVQPTEAPSVETEDLPLTPEELSHKGTHMYHMVCEYSDGSRDDLSYEMTWEFTEEGLYMDGDGPIPARNIDNFYGFTEEDFILYITFEADLVREDAGFYEEDEKGNLVWISVICTYALADE